MTLTEQEMEEREGMIAAHETFSRLEIEPWFCEAHEEIRKLRQTLTDFGAHHQGCVAGQFRQGKPSEAGYIRLYGYLGEERWYREGEEPPCSCGFREMVLS